MTIEFCMHINNKNMQVNQFAGLQRQSESKTVTSSRNGNINNHYHN